MPRELFNSLSQNKKNKIFTAAKFEFIRYSFEEASISRIAKNARISRGSFYLYFENKMDVYLFVLSENRRIILEMLERALIVHKTLFEMALDLYDFVTSFATTAEQKFFERVMSNLSPAVLDYYTINIRKNDGERFNFKNLGDYDLLNIHSTQDLTAMLELVLTITIFKIGDVYLKRTSVETGRANLIKKLNILKKACYKN